MTTCSYQTTSLANKGCTCGNYNILSYKCDESTVVTPNYTGVADKDVCTLALLKDSCVNNHFVRDLDNNGVVQPASELGDSWDTVKGKVGSMNVGQRIDLNDTLVNL